MREGLIGDAIVQAHLTPERVSLFSRILNNVSAAYPEIVAALREVPGSFALDGEIVAERDGRVLPFRYLQARLQRKDVSAELLAEVPVRYVVFDALAHGERFLLEEPLADRRAALTEILGGSSARIELALWNMLETVAISEAVNRQGVQRPYRCRNRGDDRMLSRPPPPPRDAARAYAELGLGRNEIVVEPEIVVEIAFDIIQRSELHASGFSLRFPRIVRLRPGKPAGEADTLARVVEIYDQMLVRERVDAET